MFSYFGVYNYFIVELKFVTREKLKVIVIKIDI